VPNNRGYYDRLLALLKDVEAAGFLHPKHHCLLLVEAGVETLLERMRAHVSPVTRRWARLDER